MVKQLTRRSVPHKDLLARWRRGNAAVCKTAMRGFESLSGLQAFVRDCDFLNLLRLLRKSGTKPLYAGANPAVASKK